MTRVVFIDVVGGAAGDMLLAALIDAGAAQDRIREAVESVIPGRFEFRTETVRRGGLRARWLRVEVAAGHEGRKAATRSLREMLSALDAADLSPRVRRDARSVIARLDEAEVRVHGVDSSELAIHELGDDDTLLDVVGVAAALEALDVDRMFVSVLPLGGTGSTTIGAKGHDHDVLPLPAPAAVELLRGFDVRGASGGETVTPTAAAIFAALGTPVTVMPRMKLEAVGCGAGTRDPEGVPNVLRVLLGTVAERESDQEPLARDLLVMETNLDDLTPELTADAVRALFAAGALDVWVTPASMKKGRPGFVLSALVPPDAEQAMASAFFETTSTFGVRTHQVRRTELARRVTTVPVGDGEVRIKIGLLGGRVVSATPEHDDVAELARRAGRPIREMYEEAVAAARALRLEGAET